MKNRFMDAGGMHVNQGPFECAECHKHYKTGETYVCYVISEFNPTRMRCLDCVDKKVKLKSSIRRFMDGRLYQNRPAIKGGKCCIRCGKLFFPKDGSEQFEKRSQYSHTPYDTCPECIHNIYSSAYYCFNCGCMHGQGECKKKSLHHNFKTSYSSEIYFSGYKDSKSRKANGEEELISITRADRIYCDMRELPFQEEKELPQKIVDSINYFYGCNSLEERNAKIYTNTYFHWEDIDVCGEVSIKLENMEKRLKQTIFENKYGGMDSRPQLPGISDADIETGHKQNKYRNMYFDSIDDDGYVIRKYADIFGNVREKKESVNVFYKAQGLDIDNQQATISVTYRMSTNIWHKLDVFERNDASDFNSCQRSGNAHSYARGAYDTITNGCICPILIYKKDNPKRAVGRITTRIMYDRNGEEYILIDRLYHDGTFSKQQLKGEVYKAIALDLKAKGFKVIVSNYSAHDNSTLQYLRAFGVIEQGIVTDLYQPLRQLIAVDDEAELRRGYYSDGGTVCYTTEINDLRWSTDYLDKAYLI